MLNRAKRNDRIIREKEEEKRNSDKDRLIEELKREVNHLKNDLDLAYELQNEADKNAEILEKLYQKNIIDYDGNLQNKENFGQDEMQ